ncbi:aspartate aminotransferase family protein [Leptospira kmetyi]|uniref:Acetylornithine aminotransferase n=1 Tax=Leptospira kmetyi TaxID=408139 RepID=A0A2M9XMF0_9LEPT|nr:aspartate aminotransferase family protein [Leptospira kmetyi]AYV54284.1 aspartate aminotransferase family protein [Leptospira kmetyi]EQA52562.1 transaminase, acetylornithine/succinylornithine family [Leptospira kmetyi serovar Malaysia str. Bejo-Iso9]PJZ28633.1 aspartate aminotransferase family protein [Leptospira kmetyi]PJZ40424.1 aspartate aminotransferase family protein [Leptospira kmetyi]TGK22626.1 aspartate aminotransferase family protein [Leptospira kmetyi]
MNDTDIHKELFQHTKELADHYLLNTYARYNVAFRYGVNELLFDYDNKQYIDFHCGVAVTNLGHADPDIIEVVRSQADKLFHTSNLFYSEEAANLAELLILNSFPGKVFLTNSGTEAIEGAFKLARKYADSRSIVDPIILSLEKSFHGRSVSGMSLTGQDKIRKGYGELLKGIEFVEPNNDEALVTAFERYQGRIVALIEEPIIGESGIIPLSNSFLTLSRELTAENEALLIFDEIQTGIGRTGTLFAFETMGFAPDAMTLAKGLGSGFPIGALIVGEKYQDLFTQGSHGSTFGGNHLAAAIAYETIRIIQTREILNNVNLCSDIAFTRLREMKEKYPVISEVRGKGLHIGVVLKVPSRPVAEACLAAGLVVNATAENVIRIMPPLTISSDFLNQGLDIFESVLKQN